MNAAVLIARYLVATGRRDQAIARLVAANAIAELDELDAGDELATIARPVGWGDQADLGRALGRRRRFDRLKQLVGPPPMISAALEGLWRAPAEPSDAVLIRDVLVPAAAGHERGDCGLMLALLGDVDMARAIADELTEHVSAAPIVAALGDVDRAHAMLAEETTRVRAIHDDDIDGYGIPDRDAIDYAHAKIEYVPKPGMPWRPQRPVSNRFIGTSRYGANREQHEAWGNALAFRIEAGDIAGVLALVAEVTTREPAHLKWFLGNVASRMRRSMLDTAVARQLVDACADVEGAWQMAGMLAEAGFLAHALELVGKFDHPWANARVGAQLVPHDRAHARRLIAKGLQGYGDAKTLAEFVDEDLESAIRRP